MLLRAAPRRSLPGSFALAALLTTGMARATPEADARDLFAQARALRNAGDCAQAVPLFRRAATVYPQALGPLRNLAECEEVLGHFASARRAWLDLGQAVVATPNEKYSGWDVDAQEAAKRLEPKVATLTVDVVVRRADGESVPADPTELELFVNGEPVAASVAATPLERDPGPHVVRARAKDGRVVEEAVSLAGGESRRVTLVLERVAPPSEALPAAGAPAPAPAENATRRTIGWAVTGVGAAALVGSIFTFRARQDAQNELDGTCPSHHGCPSSLRDVVDKGDTMSTLTAVLVPVGIAGLAGGLTLVVLSRPQATPGTASLRVAPTLGGLSFSGDL